MSLLTDIQQMQREGFTEEEIMNSLKQRGVPPREVSEALAQTKIRDAVVGAPEAPVPVQPESAPEGYAASSTTQVPEPIAQPAPVQGEQYPPQQEQYPQYRPEAAGQYPAEQYPQQYQQYAPQALSSDTISEISEQIVSEKLSPLRTQIEKVIDLKTTVEAKLEYLDERIKRIEKIIDRLQLSVLQKVGEYVTNVDDIKKELVETQKSFKALLPESKPKKERPVE